MTRPKSTITKMRSSSSGATMANSTIDCERWARTCAFTFTATSEDADQHVSVDREMDRVAQDTLHEPGRESKAHNHDHVDVLALEAVVSRSGSQVQAGRAVVADVQQWLVDAAGCVGGVGIRRVVLEVSVRGGGAGRARGGLERRGGQAGAGGHAVHSWRDRLVVHKH